MVKIIEDYNEHSTPRETITRYFILCWKKTRREKDQSKN